MSWRKGQSYGQDLRDRVLATTGSTGDVAARFEVSKSFVSRIRIRHSERGESTPGVQCNHVPPKLSEPMLVARVQGAARSDIGTAVPMGAGRVCDPGWGDDHVEDAEAAWIDAKKRPRMPPSRSVQT